MIDSTRKENYQPKELIDYIQALRVSDEALDVRFEAFVKYFSLLVKAPITLLLTQNSSSKWNIVSDYGLETYPEVQKEELVEVALGMNSRVVKNGFAYERASINGVPFSTQMSVAVKLTSEHETVNSFIYFIVEYQSQQQLSEMIIRALLNCDIPSFFNKNKVEISRKKALFEENSESLSVDVLEILSKVIFEEKFLLASMFLVNEVATRFNCSQVSIGWEKGNYINPVAISHIEKFDKNMESIRALEALYEESADQDEEIIYPLQELGNTIVFAHHHYVDSTKARELVSIPFRDNGRVIAVMTCEKIDGSFSEKEFVLLRLLSNYITPWMNDLYVKDRWFGGRLLLKSRNYLGKFFSLKNTFLKFSAVLLSTALIYGAFETWNYKVEVTASLETDNITFISAPFNGLVYSVNVHAGDYVKKGEALLMFDKDELYLNEAEALADINKYTSESEKARAKNSLADMRVALSKKKEAELSLKRVHYYLKKSDILSPLKGVVLTGDKEELLGAPISKGDLLFKVAQSTDLYLKLKIPQNHIDELNTTLEGEFALLSSPEKKYHFVIQNIIPMAEVDKNEGNVFIAKAKVLDAPEDWWRAGMSGVAKIEVGERNILWILTHEFVEFVRLYFWI